MRTLVAVIAAAAVALTVAAAGSTQTGKPSLDLLKRQPLIVLGQHFASRERVRLELSTDDNLVRRARTSTTGSFVVTFGETTLTRCDVIRVVATGSTGDRATLKELPAPACSPG